MDKSVCYDQLCVWRGTTLGDYTVDDFVAWFKEEFGLDMKYAEEVETTGGRIDQFFWVDTSADNFSKFCVRRLEYGISWWEDIVVYNDHGGEYPTEVLLRYLPQW